uniref:Saposin B-type domain-containing protein n=1 Tax=Dromaius novaehollandiae TaxID=8790 RepID=A0A8C4KAY9_DRONO
QPGVPHPARGAEPAPVPRRGRWRKARCDAAAGEALCQRFREQVGAAVPDVSLSPQKGIPCHLCRMAVSVVGKILQDNCTEEKLHGFLQKKCQVLPFQDWVVKCKKMVDTGILVLTQLGKQADPKVVCGTLRLCQPRQRPAGALRFRQPPPPASPREDFARLVAPFTADVPLLRQPQDARRGPALPAPREQGDVCGDCARLVAALRAQVDTGALGVPAVRCCPSRRSPLQCVSPRFPLGRGAR